MQEELSIRPADTFAREEHLLALPFESGSIQCIDCRGVLAHVVDLEGALLELLRVLRPGGHLVIGETNAASLYARRWEPIERGLKRLLGSPLSARTRSPHGIEEWYADGRGGGTLVRRIDPDFLVGFLARHGVALVERSATALVEADPNSRLGSIVERANRWYAELGGPPSLALLNLFVFQKLSATSSPSRTRPRPAPGSPRSRPSAPAS